MAYPNPFDAVRIPTEVLVALDWRPFRFAVQPYHYLIRLIHLVSMAAFFGGIVVLDMRLVGWRPTLPLRPLANQIQPWLYVTFAITVVSGFALFFYEPVQVGSHAYFVPKLILTALGLFNAAVFSRSGHLKTLAHDAPPMQTPSARARIAGIVSLLLWIGVVVFACLNVEAAPRVLLR